MAAASPGEKKQGVAMLEIGERERGSGQRACGALSPKPKIDTVSAGKREEGREGDKNVGEFSVR